MIFTARKKPVEVQVLRLTPDTLGAAVGWMRINGCNAHIRDGKLVVPTLNGEVDVNMDDYLVRGVDGEFYPCRGDIFHQTYEEPAEN